MLKVRFVCNKANHKLMVNEIADFGGTHFWNLVRRRQRTVSPCLKSDPFRIWRKPGMGVAKDSALEILRWECLSVMLECREVGILLIYQPSSCPAGFLTGLLELVSGLVWRSTYLLMRDFNLLLWKLAPVRSGNSWPPGQSWVSLR